MISFDHGVGWYRIAISDTNDVVSGSFHLSGLYGIYYNFILVNLYTHAYTGIYEFDVYKAYEYNIIRAITNFKSPTAPNLFSRVRIVKDVNNRFCIDIRYESNHQIPVRLLATNKLAIEENIQAHQYEINLNVDENPELISSGEDVKPGEESVFIESFRNGLVTTNNPGFGFDNGHLVFRGIIINSDCAYVPIDKWFFDEYNGRIADKQAAITIDNVGAGFTASNMDWRANGISITITQSVTNYNGYGCTVEFNNVN